MSRFIGIAELCAPIVGTLVACAGFAATGGFVLGATPGAATWVEVATHWLGMYLAFGLPLAYVAEAILLAVRPAGGFHGPAAAGRVLVLAGAVGGLMVGATWTVSFDMSLGLATVPSGMVGGLAAGATYLVLQRPRARVE